MGQIDPLSNVAGLPAGDARTARDLAFISYSHEDGTKWLERLLVVLKPYLKRGHLRVWADPYIRVGDRWEREIANALERARVGVVLGTRRIASGTAAASRASARC